jgi:hypothetical protein
VCEPAVVEGGLDREHELELGWRERSIERDLGWIRQREEGTGLQHAGLARQRVFERCAGLALSRTMEREAPRKERGRRGGVGGGGSAREQDPVGQGAVLGAGMRGAQ